MNITLATLAQATPQQVFDQVVTHLRTQGKKSLLNDQHCVYRGDGGLKCAAGCLISDAEMEAMLEVNVNVNDGLSWVGLINNNLAPKEHRELVAELQYIHDHKEIDAWETEFEVCAGNFELYYMEPT
jgi:hypothetical protein